MALIMSRALRIRGLPARLPAGKRFCTPLFIAHVTWVHDDRLPQTLSLRMVSENEFLELQQAQPYAENRALVVVVQQAVAIAVGRNCEI